MATVLVCEPASVRAIGETARFAAMNAGEKQDFSDIGLASNAWGIGADLTENGRGVLLGRRVGLSAAGSVPREGRTVNGEQ